MLEYCLLSWLEGNKVEGGEAEDRGWVPCREEMERKRGYAGTCQKATAGATLVAHVSPVPPKLPLCHLYSFSQSSPHHRPITGQPQVRRIIDHTLGSSHGDRANYMEPSGRGDL